MTVTTGFVQARNGARICYQTEQGCGVPTLTVTQMSFPCGSVLATSPVGLSLTRGGAGSGLWYTLDWEGTGRSSRSSGPVTADDLVADMEAVAGTIGEPFDLIAVNDACGPAMAFAALRPELVRRLQLVAPQCEALLASEFTRAASAAWLADPVTLLSMFLNTVLPRIDPTECSDLAKRALAAAPLSVVVPLRTAAMTIDPLALAGSVRTPTLVIAAGFDLPFAFDLAAAMPNAQAVDWTTIGDGSIDTAAWRRTLDERIPMREPANETRAPGESSHVAGRLSSREAEVLQLVSEGLSNVEIAERLTIARATVARHVANILMKLEVLNRLQAATVYHELLRGR